MEFKTDDKKRRKYLQKLFAVFLFTVVAPIVVILIGELFFDGPMMGICRILSIIVCCFCFVAGLPSFVIWIRELSITDTQRVVSTGDALVYFLWENLSDSEGTVHESRYYYNRITEVYSYKVWGPVIRIRCRVQYLKSQSFHKSLLNPEALSDQTVIDRYFSKKPQKNKTIFIRRTLEQEDILISALEKLQNKGA